MISIQILAVVAVFASMGALVCLFVIYKIYRDVPDEKPNKADVMAGFGMAGAVLAMCAAFAIGTAVEHSMEIEKLEREGRPSIEEKSQ